MKKLLLFFTFFLLTSIAFSQNDAVQMFIPQTGYMDYKDNKVKNLMIKQTRFTKKENGMDTLLLLSTKIEFSKNRTYLKRSDYDKFGNIYQVIEYDSYGRVKK